MAEERGVWRGEGRGRGAGRNRVWDRGIGRVGYIKVWLPSN